MREPTQPEIPAETATTKRRRRKKSRAPTTFYWFDRIHSGVLCREISFTFESQGMRCRLAATPIGGPQF